MSNVTETLTLAAFLSKVLDEIEAEQRDGLEKRYGGQTQWHRLDCGLNTYNTDPCDCDVPARVLADVAAKRQQIAHLIHFMEGDYAPWNETQLKIMVSVYADHPEFNPDWLMT